jgi:hypothetical protein
MTYILLLVFSQDESDFTRSSGSHFGFVNRQKILLDVKVNYVQGSQLCFSVVGMSAYAFFMHHSEMSFNIAFLATSHRVVASY